MTSHKIEYFLTPSPLCHTAMYLMFKKCLLTIFLMQEYGQRLDKANGTFSGQISPEVPSGLIKEFSIRFKQKFVDLFVRSLAWHYLWMCPSDHDTLENHIIIISISSFCLFFKKYMFSLIFVFAYLIPFLWM